MDSMPFTVNEESSNFTTANETQPTITTESYTSNSYTQSSVFSPMAAPFKSRLGNDPLTQLPQHEPRHADTGTPQGTVCFSDLGLPYHNRINNNSLSQIPLIEPRHGDTAPVSTGIDDLLVNMQLNASDPLFEDVQQMTSQGCFGDGGWLNSSGSSGDMMDPFDFLIKSISSANNYVSMLTREQLHVLRSIRPSLLYDFLQEIAKLRSDKRTRRALPNECAFCKNNGENEDCYSSHALKDARGRVLCPVLRAFRCPRCGATGDRAHTIKYCPDNADGGLERAGVSSRRRMTSEALLMPRVPAAPQSPAPQQQASVWSTFGYH